MKDRTRNIVVGLTVLMALAILAGLIVLFAGLPSMFQRGQTILVEMESSPGARPGDSVHIAGLRVGRITDMRFTDPAVPLKGVTISLRVDEDVYVSPNSILVAYRGMMGPAFLAIEPGELHGMEAMPIPPADQSPPGPLVLKGMVISTGPLDDLKPALGAVSDVVTQVNELTGHLINTTDSLSGLITSLNNTAHKIEAGEGSLGKLISDPRLYDELVGAVGQMNRTAAQFSVLAKRWATEGITLTPK